MTSTSDLREMFFGKDGESGILGTNSLVVKERAAVAPQGSSGIVVVRNGVIVDRL